MIQVINLGALPQGVALRPSLGVSTPFIDPDDDAFELLEGVTEEEQEQARKGLLKSSKDLEDAPRWIEDIGKVYDDWIQDANLAEEHVRSELRWLNTNVFQRTGSPEAERELATAWIKVGRLARNAVANPPSFWRNWAVNSLQFIIWMIEGAEETIQEYMVAATKAAGPVLEKYHAAVNRIQELRAELEEAKISGAYEVSRLAEQERAIDRGEFSLAATRKGYLALSIGVSLDDVAQAEFGQYHLGLGGPIAWMLGVTAVLGLIAVTVTVIMEISALAQKSPVLFVGGLVALGAIIFLPGILKS